MSATHDIVISGGGLVGSAMMAALLQLRSRLSQKNAALAASLNKIALVDAGSAPSYDSGNLMHQLRTCSITPVSSKIMENLKCWNALTTKHAFYRISVRHESANGPYYTSKTSSRSLLEFVDLNNPVGFVCYNTEMHASMVSVIQQAIAEAGSSDEIIFGSRLESLTLPEPQEFDGSLGTAQLEEKLLKFKLVLGCEGRASNLRDIIESPSVQHDYSQVAFVCAVKVLKPVDGNVTSFQNFFCDGTIVAMLPTSDDSANIVFSTSPQYSKKLLKMEQADLINELNARLHLFAPSDIPKIVDVPHQGEKRVQGSFPLRLTVTTKPYAPRAICLGDAAHGIHPFAGQGLNLGIYDICALCEVLEDCISCGHDIGNCITVGQKFAGEMLAHTLPVIAGMESIKFICHSVPSLATLGMKILNKMPIISPVAKKGLLYAASGGTFANRHSKSFLLTTESK